MPNLTVIDGKSKTNQPQYIAKIDYTDGVTDLVRCTMMGVSDDIPNFVVFHDELSLERGAPKCIVQAGNIRKITLIDIEALIDEEDQELRDSDYSGAHDE